jgi:hypothetical protein
MQHDNLSQRKNFDFKSDDNVKVVWHPVDYNARSKLPTKLVLCTNKLIDCNAQNESVTTLDAYLGKLKMIRVGKRCKIVATLPATCDIVYDVAYWASVTPMVQLTRFDDPFINNLKVCRTKNGQYYSYI